MTVPSVPEILTLIVLAGAVVHAVSLFVGPGWSRFECPECGLTIRFRGVSPVEEESLRLQMSAHTATHEPKKVGE
ncbi:hypothetical protein ACIRP0_13155 [Streptomyces sp. NPDC101733]|uniref:hypothetical protein n=1 Tax=unclassified Streptomyces TaxID=2593676 RepID=UPI00381B375A